MSDESSLAFRAVGMMDFDESPVQTTPLEWFDPSTSSGQVQPWWLRLSFHDQPPLLFLIQNGFMKVFGESAVKEIKEAYQENVANLFGELVDVDFKIILLPRTPLRVHF